MLYTCALVYLNASSLVPPTWLAHHSDRSLMKATVPSQRLSQKQSAGRPTKQGPPFLGPVSTSPLGTAPRTDRGFRPQSGAQHFSRTPPPPSPSTNARPRAVARKLRVGWGTWQGVHESPVPKDRRTRTKEDMTHYSPAPPSTREPEGEPGRLRPQMGARGEALSSPGLFLPPLGSSAVRDGKGRE